MNSLIGMMAADSSTETPAGLDRATFVPASPDAPYAPIRYGEDRRPNWFALAASASLGAGLLSFLVGLNMVVIKRQTYKPTIVAMLSDSPPAPPLSSPPAPAKPAEITPPSTVVVAPQPLVQTIAPPVQVATAPTYIPVPETRPTPTPAPVATPAIESAGDLSSKMIEARPPRYPLESRRKHEQGTVILSVLLDTSGRVAEISVSRSSGSERLDRAALEAVRRWRWSPTHRGGAPVMVRGRVEIPFELTR